MVSSIYTAQHNGILSDIWKFQSNFTASFAFAGNVLMFIMFIDKYIYPNTLRFLNVNYVSDPNYNFLISIFLQLIIPIMLINYYAVFYNFKYKKLIANYESYYHKKTFAIYFIISMLVPIIYVLSRVEIR